ncbi:ion channel [uncultured Muribaculum sp.]|uniref:ion channel n=1 Tax=uncultured Muribaculum sp. TaxID=1918613 RepID=UPI0025B1FEA2|nr:ion channel [uncultured Muribaculum sp.]
MLISYDAFRNISFIANETYLKLQFWICLFFIFDIAVEFFLYPKKWTYFCQHLLFFIVSIPYLNIIAYYNIQLSPEMLYLVRFIPMIRAAYVLAIVLGVLSTDKISSMFAAYVGLLITTVYFASLMFFIEEHYVNPGVTTFWSSLWWAFMDVTTVGCNINAITPTGKVLAVILAAEGLILFPVFTVYITNAMTRKGTDNTTQGNNTTSKPATATAAPAAASTASN